MTTGELDMAVLSHLDAHRHIEETTCDSTHRTGERNMTWYDWSEHMKKYFRALPGIFNLPPFQIRCF